jgi:hypothetical protein
VLQVVIGLADPGSVEGIGFHQVRAGFQVGIVYLADDLGPGQRQQVVVALEIAAARMVVGMGVVCVAVMTMFEARASEPALVQIVPLQHGAHAAIEDQNASLQRLFQQSNAFGVKPGQGTHRRSSGAVIYRDNSDAFSAACWPAG